MTLLYLVAKAGVIREDGKCFDKNTLKLHAKESPDKYEYLEGSEELWLRKPKEKKNVDQR